MSPNPDTAVLRGRPRWRARRWAVVAAVGLVLTLTAACASSGSSGGDGARGVAKVAIAVNDSQGMLLDPIKSRSGFHPWMQLMYDTMIYQTPEGLKPGLATAWDFPDTKTIKLTLRQGVRFQDGTPLDAAAVKFSWDRIIAATDMQKSAEISALESVEAPTADQVVVHLKSPFAVNWRERFLYSATQLAVVSPTAVKAAGDGFSSNPVNAGAGPYSFVSYTAPNQKVVLKANPNYWNPSAVSLAGVEFINTAAGTPQVASILSGTTNIAFMLGNDAAQAKAAGLQTAEFVRLDYGFGAYFCTNKAPFDNLQARQAVLHAIDRHAYVTQAYAGYAKENATVVPTSSPAHPNLSNPYPFDVAKAKELLAAAGVAPGTTVTVMGNSNNLNNAAMQVMQSQFDAIGLKLEIIPSPFAFADLKTRNPDIYFQGEGTAYVGQNIFVSPKGTANWCGFNDAGLDAALAKATDVKLTSDQWNQAWADYQKVYDAVAPGFSVADPERVTVFGPGVAVTSTQDPSIGEPPAWAGITVKG